MKLHAEKKRSRSLGTSSSSRIQDGWDNVVLLTDDYDEFQSIVRCPLPPLLSGSQNPLGFDGSSASCGCGVAVLQEGELQKLGEKK
ncbi:hypothetical protein C1H46_010837 [Malus baccata]|uniref:Uncharacterized protein n=1 Tax=Malus baccata TaxID=106549 RepID=A0A540MXJ8_MALBA|nr:hypothetical protein C1H46_010837 [Malus baccata]